jgi:hypothetical protein
MTKITPQLPPLTAQISTTASPRSTTSVQKELDPGTTRTANGIQVSLSPEARKKAEEAKQRNADIDASHLPDGIKDSLKAIREIEQKLADKVQELAQLATDKSLNTDKKDSKAKQLQIEISALRTGLSSAQSALNNAMSAQSLSADDQKLAHALVGRA